MCEIFSKTRTCPSQAKNISTCQKSAGGGEIITEVGSSVTVQIDANDNGGGIISFPIDSLTSVIQENMNTALFEDGLAYTYLYLLEMLASNVDEMDTPIEYEEIRQSLH